MRDVTQGAMPKGTRLKQLEIRLEFVEFGMTHTQEAIHQEDLAEWKEAMQAAMEKQQEAMNQCQETVELQGWRINIMLSMLSSLPQF